MDKAKSSMKAVSAKSSQKRVTFKMEIPSISQVSEKLDSAMRFANEVMKLESDNQQLLKDIKGLYPQFHAQCLTRYKIEKTLNDKTANVAAVNGLVEKHREYMELVAKIMGTGAKEN